MYTLEKIRRELNINCSSIRIKPEVDIYSYVASKVFGIPYEGFKSAYTADRCGQSVVEMEMVSIMRSFVKETLLGIKYNKNMKMTDKRLEIIKVFNEYLGDNF